MQRVEKAAGPPVGSAPRQPAAGLAHAPVAPSTFADQRSEAIAQRELLQLIERSPRVAAPRACDERIHSSPRMVAQREQLRCIFGGACGTPVQRYRDMTVGGEPWRLSENNRALAKTSGAPGDRSHYLWADAGLVGQANIALDAAGSFIKLESTGNKKQVLLHEEGHNATLEEEVKIDAQKLSQAGSSGGDEHNYFAALNQRLEVNEPTGVDALAEELSSKPSEKSGKEIREEALKQRREAARLTDRTVELPGVKPVFLPAKAGKGKTYEVMKDQQLQSLQPQTLWTPSDCNETARVVMGVKESQRNEEPVVNSGKGPATVKPQEVRFGKLGSGATVVENGGLTALAAALTGYDAVVGLRELPSVQVETYRRLREKTSDPGKGLNMLRELQELASAVSVDFEAWAQINGSARPEIGDALVTFRLDKSGMDPSRDPRLYQALVTALTTHLKLDEQAAKKVLDKHSIDEKTTYYTLAQNIDAFLLPWLKASHDRIDREDLDRAHEAAVKAGEANILWNKHWGGVVLKDGGDFVTLENDSSSKDKDGNVAVGTQETKVNQHWGFAMYGTGRQEQTFHHQMMQTGDFGDFASTMRFRRGPREEKPQVKEGELLATEKRLLEKVAECVDEGTDIDVDDLITDVGKDLKTTLNMVARNGLRMQLLKSLGVSSWEEAVAKARERHLIDGPKVDKKEETIDLDQKPGTESGGSLVDMGVQPEKPPVSSLPQAGTKVTIEHMRGVFKVCVVATLAQARKVAGSMSYKPGELGDTAVCKDGKVVLIELSQVDDPNGCWFEHVKDLKLM